MQSVGSAGLGAMAEINDQSGGLVLFPWTLVPSFVPDAVRPASLRRGRRRPADLDPDRRRLPLSRLLRSGAPGAIWSEGAPAGYLGAIMVPLGFYLFFKGQDFGLFKLAMFAQPVITLFASPRDSPGFLFNPRPRVRRWARAALVVFFLCTRAERHLLQLRLARHLRRRPDRSRGRVQARRALHPAEEPQVRRDRERHQQRGERQDARRVHPGHRHPVPEPLATWTTSPTSRC